MFLAEANSKIYNAQFFENEGSHNFKSAEMIVPLVLELVHPKNMIDVGCGVGPWVKVFQNHGVDSYGIDGDYVNKNQLLIDEKNFLPWNLESRFDLNKKFDLAITLEVAEHLTPQRAVTFVEDLTKLSDVILFSAAITAQGGTNHINEQFQNYWVEIFKKHGFVAIDYLRPQIWQDTRIEICYRQNILLYVRETSISKYPRLFNFYLKHCDEQILDVVHPEMFMLRTNQFNYAIMKIKELEKIVEKLSTPPPRKFIIDQNFFINQSKKIKSSTIQKSSRIFLIRNLFGNYFSISFKVNIICPSKINS